MKWYAIQERNKNYSTKWDSYATIFDNEKDARNGFQDHILNLKNPKYDWEQDKQKKIARLVSFIVTDNNVAFRDRPEMGCIILEVLEYYEDK